jgi:hypothetical protein
MNQNGHISVSHANIEWAKERLALAERKPVGEGHYTGTSITYMPARDESTPEGKQRIAAALRICEAARISNVRLAPKDGVYRLYFGHADIIKLDKHLRGYGPTLGISRNGS